MLNFFNFKTSNKISLSDDYFNFMWVVFRLILILCVVILYFSYVQNEKKFDKLFNESANSISEQLHNIFSDNSRTLRLVGEKIIEGDWRDPYFILNNFREIDFFDYTISSFRTSLTWINTDNQVVVSTLKGVLNPPIHTHFSKESEFVKNSYNKPWIPQFSSTVHQSLFFPEKKVVHVGMGVTTKDGKVIGRISTCLMIDEIVRVLKTLAIKSKDLAFIVTDHDNHVVLHSGQLPNITSSYLNLQDKDDRTFEVGDIKFRLTKRIDHYALKLYLGVPNSIYQKHLILTILPKIVEVFIMGFFCLIILFLYRKEILKPISDLSHAADKISEGKSPHALPSYNTIELNNLARGLKMVRNYVAKIQAYQTEISDKNAQLKKEKTKLKKEREKAIETQNEVSRFRRKLRESISEQVNMLLQCFSQLQMSGEHNANAILGRLKNVAQSLNQMVTVSTNFQEVDINQLIAGTIKIHATTIYQNSVTFKQNLSHKIPMVNVDEVTFKKAMINLLGKSILTSPRGNIQITTQPKDNGLLISIIDDGFHLTLDDMERISINSEIDEAVCCDINMELIREIIREHKGHLALKLLPDKGKVITVFLPAATLFETSNIHHFTKKDATSGPLENNNASLKDKDPVINNTKSPSEKNTPHSNKKSPAKNSKKGKVSGKGTRSSAKDTTESTKQKGDDVSSKEQTNSDGSKNADNIFFFSKHRR